MHRVVNLEIKKKKANFMKGWKTDLKITGKTDKGIQRKHLCANTDPVVEFALLDNEKLQEAYAYCNLHGLWMIKA